MKWHPIYTVPIDGRQVLVWMATYFQGAGCYDLARWDENVKQLTLFNTMTARGATHWADLPEPPDLSKEGE